MPVHSHRSLFFGLRYIMKFEYNMLYLVAPINKGLNELFLFMKDMIFKYLGHVRNHKYFFFLVNFQIYVLIHKILANTITSFRGNQQETCNLQTHPKVNAIDLQRLHLNSQKTPYRSKLVFHTSDNSAFLYGKIECKLISKFLKLTDKTTTSVVE